MATTQTAPRNYREYAWLSSPGTWRGFWGKRFIGVLGLAFDALEAGVETAVQATKLAYSGFPADALTPLGIERSMPQLPGESDGLYKARLQDAWRLWQQSGTDSGIIELFADAGYAGVRLFSTHDWPTAAPTGWWSQFWLLMPVGTHPVTGLGKPIGTFTVGDGTIIGPTGLSAADIAALRTTVRNFKRAEWICRALIFQISGWTIGGGRHVGDTGLTIGAEQASIGVY